ncbi:MAG: THUMP domain-containing protein [Euryarchaeota archaeon]|nr:THUMP domain-containing protein [Euryarchaeota archaeon]
MVAGNMLVTFRPNEKGHAEDEMRARLKDVNVHVESVEETNVEGVFEVLILGDPKKVVRDLRFLCIDAPELFLHTHHWVPIERWVDPYIDEMVRAAKEYEKEIKDGERWMLHLHKRHIGKHSADLIEKLTAPINRGKVDLEKPEKILVVEILGDRAGMSLVRSDELLDVGKIREQRELEMI